MKSSTSLVLSAAVIFCAAMTATAFGIAPQAGVRVAIINGQRMLEDSNVGKAARQQIEERAAYWTNLIQTEQTALSSLNQQQRDGSLTLNQDALAQLSRQIEEKQVTVERLDADARRELQRLEEALTGQVNSQLGPLVERLARERGFDLILDSSRLGLSGLLYFNPSLDVTDEFTTLVNSTIASEENP